jgi:chromosome segregation ATPase
MNFTASIPSNDEIHRESNPIRKAILSAIQRILLGHPKKSPLGASSISDLAREADIGRHYLYQESDLKERFEFLRDNSQQVSATETRLLAEVSKLKDEVKRLTELQSRTYKASGDWKELTYTLERALNVLQEELRQEQIKSERLSLRLHDRADRAAAASVIPIRNRPDLQHP